VVYSGSAEGTRAPGSNHESFRHFFKCVCPSGGVMRTSPASRLANAASASVPPPPPPLQNNTNFGNQSVHP
jgi:hypothetical protein